MQRLLSALLAALLIFSLAACRSGQAEGNKQPNQSGGAALSEPASNPSEEDNKPPPPPRGTGPSRLGPRPPVLKILDSSGMGIEANVGTYSWTYNNWDGTWTSVEADSSHPLERQEFLTPMTTSDATVELCFDVQPQEFTVRCWSDACWGMMDALEGDIRCDGNTLKLREGGYIYEVIAEWTGEDLASGGTVSYAFYICNCMPEFSVSTEDGTQYGVNLSECYVRCDDGQADLTVEQIRRIREILENQT